MTGYTSVAQNITSIHTLGHKGYALDGSAWSNLKMFEVGRQQRQFGYYGEVQKFLISVS
jgi:hypothetical protein